MAAAFGLLLAQLWLKRLQCCLLLQLLSLLLSPGQSAEGVLAGSQSLSVSASHMTRSAALCSIAHSTAWHSLVCTTEELSETGALSKSYAPAACCNAHPTVTTPADTLARTDGINSGMALAWLAAPLCLPLRALC